MIGELEIIEELILDEAEHALMVTVINEEPFGGAVEIDIEIDLSAVPQGGC